VVALLASLGGFFGWTVHRAVHHLGVPVWLALPVAWTATEWIQGHLPGTLAFPWLGLGTALTARPEWVGIAELVGARGVTFWLAGVSGLVARAVADLRRAGPAPSTLGVSARRAAARVLPWVVLVSTLPIAWGVVRARTLTTLSVARVAVVQSDLPAQLRADPDAWNAEASAVLARLLSGEAAGEADLVILPEGWLMGELAGDAPDADPAELGGAQRSDLALAREIRSYASVSGASVVFGAYRPEPRAQGRPVLSVVRGADPPAVRNVVNVATPDGIVREAAVKRRPVPLVETDRVTAPSAVPGAPPWGVIQVRGVHYAALICFEAVFAEDARAARRGGAEVLLNVTNDAWFEAGGWGAAAARAQHAAHLVMRAVEHRVGAVRAANGGYAFIVDPAGRVLGPRDPTGERLLVGEVRSTRGLTVYARLGDWVGWMSLLAVVLVTLMPARTARTALGQGMAGPTRPA
jgi:apolipoprotein N-acyltransferase